MPNIAVSRRILPLLFVGLVATVYTMAWVLAGRLDQMNDANTIAAALTVDLVVIVPVVFYFLVVRRRGWSVLRVAPVFILSMVAAARVLPDDHHQTLRILEYLVAPLEIGVVSWIIWRTVKALRTIDRDIGADPLDQFHQAALKLLRNERAAGIFASEIGVFYYGLASWRSRPHAPTGFSAFTTHQRSGQAGIVFGILFLIFAEGLAVHFLLAQWSVLAAWVITASSVYGALWLIGDYRASVLRPTLVGDQKILLRAGLRWTVEVSREQIASLGRTEPDLGEQKVNLCLMGGASHWITLHEPVLVNGPYGTTRWVQVIGLSPDKVNEWEHIQPWS